MVVVGAVNQKVVEAVYAALRYHHRRCQGHRLSQDLQTVESGVGEEASVTFVMDVRSLCPEGYLPTELPLSLSE